MKLSDIITDPFIASYIECALWSSTDDSDDSGGEPLDANYIADDFTSEALEQIAADCRRFQEQAGELILDDESRAGHDFWLTRNGHGAGFWDGDWPEHGDKLTAIAESFGECDIMVGDEGWLHLFPMKGN